MNRRNFLGAMLGGLAAPAVVKAEHLMKIVVAKQEIVIPSYMEAITEVMRQHGPLPKVPNRAHIGDMDINSMYDRLCPQYEFHLERIADRWVEVASIRTKVNVNATGEWNAIMPSVPPGIYIPRVGLRS